MFGIGFSEVLLILLVVAVVFGPDRLPEIGARLGKAISQLKGMSDEFRDGLKDEHKDQS
jgi:sec-independent protein translocase protein TatA